MGEKLDGEGGFTVWGKLLTAERSKRIGALPIGLAHGVTLVRPVPEGELVTWSDVQVNAESQAMSVRREMENSF